MFLLYWYRLTKMKKKLHLVFDIDHTLIRSKTIEQTQNLNIKAPDFIILNYNIWTRPYYTILNYLSKICHLHIYTAATYDYADEILNHMYDDIFDKRLYRDSWEVNHSKNLRDILTYTEDIMLIDDQLYNNYRNQKFYHIKQYDINDRFDIELLILFGHVLKIYIKKDIETIKKFLI